jgi:multidrug efflux pump subunit AcrB
VNGAIAWFARNHVAANLLMFLLVLGGLSALPSIKREVFPEISLDVITASVEYPGASPAEVEEAICVRIEEALQGLNGIKRMSSTAAESRGSVTVELLAGEDVRRRMDEIRSRVDRIESFPDDAKPPQVSQADFRFPVLDVAVAGALEERQLKHLGERVRDDLANLPEITDVELVATRDYEISIEISEREMRRHGLGFDDVALAVRRSSLDLPGGSLRTDGGEILLRTKGQAYRGSEFERLPLISRSDGTRLTLGDVATVVDGFEDGELISRFDGQPAVLVQVYRVGQQSALEIAAAVHEYIDRTAHTRPESVSLTVAQSDARFLRDRLDTLLGAGKTGFALVLLILALFLRLRLALWVSLGIPLSFLGALALMPGLDLSINLISLMAFIVVLGIVVDDAIVVGENAHTEQGRTGDSLLGAIRGAQGISIPVIFGVLTTVAAFAPMLWVPGPMGKMVMVIPLVVVLCLLFSLFESLFILPAHLGHGNAVEREPRNAVSAAWRNFQDRIATGLRRFIDERYGPLLDRALEWRYLTAALGVFTLLVTLGLLGGGWLRFHFQPEVEGEATVAYLTMPQGTPYELTGEGVQQLADAARRVEAELGGGVFKHMHTTVGQQPYKLKQAEGPASFAAAFAKGGHLGEVQIEVVPAEERDLTVAEITRRWREAAGRIPGAEELSFTSSILTAGSPLAIELRGSDLEELRAAARVLKVQLGQFAGVLDIRDSFRGGKQELELEILPSAEALGLTARDLGRQVRQAFYGEEVQRVQRGRDDVRVMVRYPAAERRSLADLENMRIRTADGTAVPFASVARVHLDEGFTSIRRVDRRRVVSVIAQVDDATSNANEILAAFKRGPLLRFNERFPDLGVVFGGEQREQADFLESLARGWTLALLVIFGLLAVPLRSYSQPLIIMSAIPFGLVGAAWGHILMSYDFSMMSVIGIVALSGVVVNDSLVLVDQINKYRTAGIATVEALARAGRARFRAIMLTSLTTFAGLTPLLLETSIQSRLLIPMAISLAFGVIYATVISLLIVPAHYLILEDLKALLGRSRSRNERSGGAGARSGEGAIEGPASLPSTSA